MSVHKIKEEKPADSQGATVLVAGRMAASHGEVGGVPLQGGLHHAVVADVERTSEDEKAKVQEYHAAREEIKKAAKQHFDAKTGKPIVNEPDLGPDPVGDAPKDKDKEEVVKKPEPVKVSK